MNRFLNISTTALALALVVLLAACDPTPPPKPEDPTPIIPEPVEEVHVLEGYWEGTLSFSDSDSFGNYEEMILGAIMDVSFLSPNIHGVFVFDTDDDECSVGGSQTNGEVSLIIFCAELEAFSLGGTVSHGVFTGSYITVGTILKNGVFGFAFGGK